jgi:hypothetical protein
LTEGDKRVEEFSNKLEIALHSDEVWELNNYTFPLMMMAKCKYFK